MSEIVDKFIETFRTEDAAAMRRSVERYVPSGHHNFSSWGHPCKRNRWYARRPIDGVRTRTERDGEGFWIGRVLEDPIAQRMSEAVGHRFSILHLDRTISIPPAVTGLQEPVTGKLDRIGMIQVEPKQNHRIVTEIKRATGSVFASVDEGPDGWHKLWESERFWLRNDVAQVVGYIAALMGETTQFEHHAWPVEDAGVLAFASIGPKEAGRIKLVKIPFSEEIVGECVATCKAAEVDDPDAIDERGGRIDFHPTTCGMCDYRTVCMQEIAGPNVALVDDKELMAWLGRWQEIKASIPVEPIEEMKDLEVKIKARARQSGPGRFFTSDARFSVTVRPPVMREQYEIPDDVKAKYRVDAKACEAVVKWEALNGEEDE